MIRTWLATHWVTGAMFMCGALILVTPAIPDGPQRLIYLAGPLYMIHQVEEHYRDRFRLFVNTYVFRRPDTLSVEDVLWINLPGVWGVNLLALYLALAFGPGWGVVVFYFMLVNALSHLIAALALRRPNPGLVSALVLFLPFSVLGIVMVPASMLQRVVGLAVAVMIHAAILMVVKRNAARAGTA